MANIKFIEIIPDSGGLGTKIINFNDMPDGLSFKRDHLRPVSEARLSDGTLIRQTIRYNKKRFNMTGVLREIIIHTYLEALYESGIGATLKVWYEDPQNSYTETTEFNGPVLFSFYDDDMDEIANTRTINAIFSEV